MTLPCIKFVVFNLMPDPEQADICGYATYEQAEEAATETAKETGNRYYVARIMGETKEITVCAMDRQGYGS